MTIFGANATESEEQSGATEPNGAAEPTGGNGPRGSVEPSGADGATDASDLDAEDLVLGYPTAPEPVIDGESIAAEPGAVTALVGPNGSGKSTLLKGLADQIEPDDIVEA